MMAKKTVYSRALLLFAALFCGLGVCARDRGLISPDLVFIEKGTKSAGLTFGFDSWEASGENGFGLLGIINGLDGYVRNTDVAAQGSFFVKDNLSVGLRVGYADTRFSIDSTSLSTLVFSDRHVTRQSFDCALTGRVYLPMFDGKVIAMFCEGRVSGSVGYYKSYKLTDNGKEGDLNDIWSASVGLYPGISVFATHNISFEMLLPFFETGVRWQRQTGTDSDGTLSRTFFKFKPNLVGLRMGVIYHF